MDRSTGGRVNSCKRHGLLGAAAVLSGSLLMGCAGREEPEHPGTPPRVRIVTTQQYLNTLQNVFGSSVGMDMKFPPLRRTGGLLANGAALAGVTAGKIETFQRAASSIVAQVVAPERRNYLIHCEPKCKKEADEGSARQSYAQP